MSADPTMRDLATRPGPVVTVYLAAPDDPLQAERQVEVKWEKMRADLRERGAPEDVLALVDPHVRDFPLRGPGLCVIAGSDGVRHVEHLPEAPPVDLGLWEPLPALLGLLKRRQSEPPFVLVMADRRGADITAYGPGGEGADGEGEAPSATVEPQPDDPDRKVRAGGWANPRFQQRAENTWDARAKEAAEHVERAAEAVRAEIVLLGGDVRAVQLLQEHLPDRWRSRVEELPGGGRATDGSEQVVADAVRRWVQTAAARRVVAVLEKYREELGQRDRAAAGPEETRAALAAGQVETLLVHDDWADERRVDDDASGGTSVRLVDVVVRDALATDADVVVVPRHGGPPGGIGAVLRWS